MLLDDGEVVDCTPEIDNCQREASLVNWGGPYLQSSAMLFESLRCVRTVMKLVTRGTLSTLWSRSCRDRARATCSDLKEKSLVKSQ